ncbi:AP2 domain containing protein [Musa troglodytarum]|uniref:AP2 domain containing protein n=1 Tax=Musa troglodytarum TaxID=320322 RepID=A0A9E7H6J0_9LILI|nr:AP2 domain containing protein [Musa troglodytarum]
MRRSRSAGPSAAMSRRSGSRSGPPLGRPPPPTLLMRTTATGA